MRELRLPGSRLVRLAPYNTFSVSIVLCPFFRLGAAMETSLHCQGLVIPAAPYPVFSRRRFLDLPGSQNTLVYICPAHGPRTNFHARPLERFSAAPAIANTKAPSIILISRLNHRAFVPAV